MILLEGILVLAVDSLVQNLDLRVFVDTAADMRFLRRLERDTAERGRSVQSVIEQYLATVRPMHRAYIEPSRHRADFILPGEGSYDVALEVLRAWIQDVVARSRS